MASNMAQMQALQQQSTTNSMLNQLPQGDRSRIETAVNEYRQKLTSQGHQSEVIQTFVWNYYTQCVQALFQEHCKSTGSTATSASMVPSSSSSSPPPSGDGMAMPSQAQPSADADQGHSLQSQQAMAQQMQQRQVELQQQRQQMQQRQQPQHQQQQQQQQQQFQMRFQQQPAGPQVIRPQFGMQNSMMGGHMPSTAVKVAPSVAPSLASSEQQSEEMDASSPSKPSNNSWNGNSDWDKSSGDWNKSSSDWNKSSGNWNKSSGDWNKSSGDWNKSGGDWDSQGHWGESTQSGMGGGDGSQPNNYLAAKAAQVARNINAVNAERAMSLGMLGSTPKSAPATASVQGWKQPQGMAMNQGTAMNQGMGMNQNQAAAGMSNGGVRFPMTAGRPPGGMIRPNTPHLRAQMQQAQHEQRMMGNQVGAGENQMGAGGWQVRAGFGAPGRPKAVPGKAPPGSFPGARPGAPGGPQFPPALQKWLQRLFAHQQQSPENDDKLQKQTHTYLRHWVQQWVKTGELWQRSWDTAPLPTPEEIRSNLPPGTLGGCGAMGITVPPPAQIPPSMQGRPAGPRVVEPPAWGNKNANAMPGGGDNSQGGFSGSGGQNKRPDLPRRRRSRSRRQRRRRSSSSSNSSRSKSGRSRSRKRKDGQDSSGSEADNSAAKGKGKAGKFGMPQKDLSRVPQEEARQQVRKFIDERLQNGVRHHKEIQNELQRVYGVNAKKFRSLFNQNLQEYCYNLQVKGGFIPVGNLEGGIRPPKVVSQGEQEMRAQRAARFQTHLQVERTAVAMVSFNEGVEASVPGGPLVGALSEMCSREEAREREMTRQLDKMEWKKGTDPRNPEVNLALATKKYQRSSADKAYRPQDTRTLDACWRTMEFLMTEILDFDKNPKPQFAIQNMPYIEVYSYLRDRTRSCRVDMHLQQPRSTTEKTFVETHEVCLRFEMLSLFLLQGESGGSTEKYDEKLGLKAISQTIEPLLNSYQAVRDKLLAKSILAEAMGGLLDADEPDGEQEYSSAFEAAVHRYIILLLMAFSPEELLTHLAKLSQEILSHPLVGMATKAFAAFQTDDYGAFLRLYREADFLTAVAMSGVADLARLRALWLLVRTYCQPVGDKLPMKRIQNVLAFSSESHARSFLAFHGVKVAADGKDGEPFVMLPKKGTPEAAQHPLLTGANKLPDKCEYPKGADSMLVSKFEALGLSRAEIVFGSADPIVEVAEPEVEVEVVEGGELPCENGEKALPPGAADAEVAAEIAKDA